MYLRHIYTCRIYVSLRDCCVCPQHFDTVCWAVWKGIWPLKNKGEDGGGGHWLARMEWRPAGWSVCLPLLIFPCTITFRSFLLALAHPGGSGKRAVKTVVVYDCCVFSGNLGPPLRGLPKNKCNGNSYWLLSHVMLRSISSHRRTVMKLPSTASKLRHLAMCVNALYSTHFYFNNDMVI